MGGGIPRDRALGTEGAIADPVLATGGANELPFGTDAITGTVPAIHAKTTRD